MFNIFLKRKKMVVDIRHQNLATPSRKLIRRKIAKIYKEKDPHSIVMFGFKSKYGGGKTTGFCLIYDNFKARRIFDYRYRLVRDKFDKKPEGSRKAKNENKNRRKKLVGREKAGAS
eukprot:966870_1